MTNQANSSHHNQEIKTLSVNFEREILRKKIKGNKHDPFFFNNYQNELYKIVCILGMKLSCDDFDFDSKLEYNLHFKNIFDRYLREENSTRFRSNFRRKNFYHFCFKTIPFYSKGNIIKSHTYIYYYCLEIARELNKHSLVPVIRRNLEIDDYKLWSILGFQKAFIHHYSHNFDHVNWIEHIMELDSLLEKESIL
jgi:hypothetical protein